MNQFRTVRCESHSWVTVTKDSEVLSVIHCLLPSQVVTSYLTTINFKRICLYKMTYHLLCTSYCSISWSIMLMLLLRQEAGGSVHPRQLSHQAWHALTLVCTTFKYSYHNFLLFWSQSKTIHCHATRWLISNILPFFGEAEKWAILYL